MSTTVKQIVYTCGICRKRRVQKQGYFYTADIPTCHNQVMRSKEEESTTEETQTAGEVILELTLAGRHQEAETIAKQVIEMYKEDPTGDGYKDDGTCNDCGHVFTDDDCQHGEIEPFILCDRCYLDRGGR